MSGAATLIGSSVNEHNIPRLARGKGIFGAATLLFVLSLFYLSAKDFFHFHLFATSRLLHKVRHHLEVSAPGKMAFLQFLELEIIVCFLFVIV